MFGFCLIALVLTLLFIELCKSKKVNRLIDKDVKKVIKEFPKLGCPRKKWIIPLICVLLGNDILTIIYAITLMHFNRNLTFFEAIFTKFTLYVFLISLTIYAICLFISIKNNNLYDISSISEFIKKYLKMNIESMDKIDKRNLINLNKMYGEEYVKINIDFHKYVVLPIKRMPPIISFLLEITIVFEHAMTNEFYEKLTSELKRIPSVKVSCLEEQIICTARPNSAKNNLYYMYLILQTIDKFLQLEF